MSSPICYGNNLPLDVIKTEHPVFSIRENYSHNLSVTYNRKLRRKTQLYQSWCIPPPENRTQPEPTDKFVDKTCIGSNEWNLSASRVSYRRPLVANDTFEQPAVILTPCCFTTCNKSGGGAFNGVTFEELDAPTTFSECNFSSNRNPCQSINEATNSSSKCDQDYVKFPLGDIRTDAEMCVFCNFFDGEASIYNSGSSGFCEMTDVNGVFSNYPELYFEGKPSTTYIIYQVSKPELYQYDPFNPLYPIPHPARYAPNYDDIPYDYTFSAPGALYTTIDDFGTGWAVFAPATPPSILAYSATRYHETENPDTLFTNDDDCAVGINDYILNTTTYSETAHVSITF
jgi:hypothetical protein